MYHTGEYVDVGQFSQEMVGQIVDDYGANAEALSERRWLKLLRNVSTAQKAETPRPIPNALSMQQRRRTLYVLSSDGPCEG
jgi:hypothetical protein